MYGFTESDNDSTSSDHCVDIRYPGDEEIVRNAVLQVQVLLTYTTMDIYIALYNKNNI